jgi:hypothetical protein
MPKPKKQDKIYDSLRQTDKAVLRNANAGVAFDTVDVKDVENKINISSQNKDTGLSSYNPDDTRPYERKNTSDGFHRSGTGSK